MPFRYQMEKILVLMEKREKAADAKVLAAKQERDIERNKLNELELRKNAAQKGLSAQMAAGATPDVAASNDYIQLLNLRMESQAKLLKAAEAVLTVAVEEQTVARRDVAKLEKHKDMKLEIWKGEEKKREAKKTDEQAGTIFMKKRAAAEESLREELDRADKMEKLKLLKALREKRDNNRW